MVVVVVRTLTCKLAHGGDGGGDETHPDQPVTVGKPQLWSQTCSESAFSHLALRPGEAALPLEARSSHRVAVVEKRDHLQRSLRNKAWPAVRTQGRAGLSVLVCRKQTFITSLSWCLITFMNLVLNIILPIFIH